MAPVKPHGMPCHDVKNRTAACSNRSHSHYTVEIEELYPYELNSQKPLNEHVNEILEQFRLWEHETGTKLRAQQLWGKEEILIKGLMSQIEQIGRQKCFMS
jgi:hypothetical protein